ncbi:ABC transporter ATP-binding protein [Acuticoccus sp. MNP-M23]|uniref:ABC transporter ATP-binding protein n=1 Tax=Acuticoccus sp. MNP-M23 TaxID=3072793 RepID=UPI002814E9F8|nr:ABC transporter ATP-binding protein [Acuticoccus sp. MNP-M23]WMS42613.1 ABC transporter ATP-binding protein [Acuticoccus sp. MNP-M23]
MSKNRTADRSPPPATGRIRLPDTETLGRDPFSGVFRRFETLIDPFAPYADQRPPADLVAFLRWGLGDVRWPVIAFGVVSLAFGAAEALVFFLIGGLVDRAVAAGPDGIFTSELWWLGGLVFAVVVAKPVTQLCQSALTSLTLGPGIHQQTIWRLHRHTLGQAMQFFEEDFAGRLSQKQMQTGNALMSVTSDTLSGLGMLMAYLVTMALLLWSAEPWLGVVVVLWALAFAFALRWGVPRVRARSKARAAARANVSGQFVDSISHMKTVKIFAHAKREETAARDAITTLRETSLAFGRAMMAMRVFIVLMNIVVTLLMIFGALWFYAAGEATVGVIAMASMMTIRLTGMSNWMAQSALSIFGELGTIEDGAATLSPPHDVVDAADAVDLGRPRGDIRFDDVTFRYGRPTGGVHGLTFHVKPGEKVGLVGRSGAGKSTAVALLLRLYDIDSGAITIDGHNIADLTQDSLRLAVGTVTQETAVFNRSALANIRYGDPGATEEAAHAAARRARAHDFIGHLADSKGRTGYEAHLGERGVKLSGGQRQRIALARAILKDAPILVLDEATSALDSEVEAEIQDALNEVMQGKTVVAIAHRLSTIAAMDKIIVIDDGRVIEEGPHTALLARGGVYADLWSRQSGGFLGAEAAE